MSETAEIGHFVYSQHRIWIGPYLPFGSEDVTSGRVRLETQCGAAVCRLTTTVTRDGDSILQGERGRSVSRSEARIQSVRVDSIVYGSTDVIGETTIEVMHEPPVAYNNEGQPVPLVYNQDHKLIGVGDQRFPEIG